MPFAENIERAEKDTVLENKNRFPQEWKFQENENTKYQKLTLTTGLETVDRWGSDHAVHIKNSKKM